MRSSFFAPFVLVVLSACEGSPAGGTGEGAALTSDGGADGGVPEGGASDAAAPGGGAVGEAVALPDDVVAKMTGVSWREGCPVALSELVLLRVPHLGFDGEEHVGEMVVAASVSAKILDVFAQLRSRGFAIERMRLVDEYGADDDASMADNNTSAFNCRKVTGGSSWSEHSYGKAVDINPVQNPYVRGTTVLPPAGKAYVERDASVPGLVVAEGPVVAAFDAISWGWGGRWTAYKDWQHFSESGR